VQRLAHFMTHKQKKTDHQIDVLCNFWLLLRSAKPIKLTLPGECWPVVTFSPPQWFRCFFETYITKSSLHCHCVWASEGRGEVC